jgi:hypothetical protein
VRDFVLNKWVLINRNRRSAKPKPYYLQMHLHLLILCELKFDNEHQQP